MNCYYCLEIVPLSAYLEDEVWVWACSWCLISIQGMAVFFEGVKIIPHSNSHFYSTGEKFEQDLSLF